MPVIFILSLEQILISILRDLKSVYYTLITGSHRPYFYLYVVMFLCREPSASSDHPSNTSHRVEFFFLQAALGLLSFQWVRYAAAPVQHYLSEISISFLHFWESFFSVNCISFFRTKRNLIFCYLLRNKFF